MKLFPVYMHDHSGDSAIEVFNSENKARDYIKEDIENIKWILEHDGCEWVVVERLSGDGWEVYVPNSDIFYEWTLFECELR